MSVVRLSGCSLLLVAFVCFTLVACAGDVPPMCAMATLDRVRQPRAATDPTDADWLRADAVTFRVGCALTSDTYGVTLLPATDSLTWAATQHAVLRLETSALGLPAGSVDSVTAAAEDSAPLRRGEPMKPIVPRWRSPFELEIAYDARAVRSTQTVLLAGIRISVSPY